MRRPLCRGVRQPSQLDDCGARDWEAQILRDSRLARVRLQRVWSLVGTGSYRSHGAVYGLRLPSRVQMRLVGNETWRAESNRGSRDMEKLKVTLKFRQRSPMAQNSEEGLLSMSRRRNACAKAGSLGATS